MQKQILSTAIRRALIRRALLVPAAGIAGILPFAVYAQQGGTSGDPADTTTLDRIEVTGTRIRQVDVENAAPVLSISRADIERQGFASVGELLQNISAVGAPAISRSSPLTAGPNVGGTFVSLRNLAPQQTLVLINGRRLGVSITGNQDLSTIPTAMVERIEVLKDGASSIYGSDAIAGVVNIITRSNYEGAMASAYYGQYDEGDGAITRGDFLMGFSGDRGSLTVGVEYTKEDEVMNSDREFVAYPQTNRHPSRGWTTASQWGVLNLPAALGGNRVLNSGADWRRIGNYHALDTDTGGATGPTGGAGSIADKSNPGEQTHLRTAQETRSLFVNGVFDFSDSVRLRADALYNFREATRMNAGYPLQSSTVSGPHAGLRMAANSYYNPLGTWHGYANPQAVNFTRRTWEVPRVETPQSTTWRLAAALEGSFGSGERIYDWDIGVLYNNNQLEQRNYGNLDTSRVAQAVGPSFLNANGVVQCGTPANPIPLTSCIPWNPLIPAGRSGDGGLTGNDALLDYLFPIQTNTGETETTVFNANLSGSLFTLPGGDLGFAVGAETRKEEGEFIPDAMSVSGVSTNLASAPTYGSYSVDELYAELLVPVLADLPGAELLSFSLASRYSDYDTFGETTNSKFGFKWKPLESVLVRGTWAQGFRAPTIANLYGGGSQTFANFTDPCDTLFGASATNAAVRARCAQDIANANSFRQLAQGFTPAPSPNAQTPVPFFSGSNPLLQPENSTSRTLGIVWSPQFASGLNMSLDWWKIRVEDTIVADTPTQILNDCYVQADSSRCVRFTRDAALGYVDTMTFDLINAGFRETEGFDFDLNYRLATDYGDFTLNWQNTYTRRDELKTATNPAALSIQLVGFATTAGAIGTFRVRSTLGLGWSRGPFGVNWNSRYFSSMKEACLEPNLFPEECSHPGYVAANPQQSGNINRLGSNTFHDVQLRWEAPWNATITFGVNNVFEHIGPPMYSNPNSSTGTKYQGMFDIGRFSYMRYQQRF